MELYLCKKFLIRLQNLLTATLVTTLIATVAACQAMPEKGASESNPWSTNTVDENLRPIEEASPTSTARMTAIPPTRSLLTETPTLTLPSTASARKNAVDLNGMKWKVAIPYRIDSCQFKIIDSFGNEANIGNDEATKQLTCHARWSPDGNKLALSNNGGVEIIDFSTGATTFFKNPFADQINENEYSILDIGRWAKDQNWIEILAVNRFEPSPMEIYQTILLDIETGEHQIFHENFWFLDWSPINDNQFAYVESIGDENQPGIQILGIWDLTTSTSINEIHGISEEYNLSNSNLLFSPSGKQAVKSFFPNPNHEFVGLLN